MPSNETRFARRGFEAVSPEVRERLEQIGQTFLRGYHAALADDEPKLLERRLNRVELEQRGFAFEGAAMGLALSDFLMPWRKSRWQSFLQGSGTDHAYMVHVGAGWALARLPFRIERSLARMNPLLRWLAVDGFGFHEGYFHSHQAIELQVIPNRVCGYGRRAFDQGLGRGLWFVRGADVRRIRQTVETFPRARRADLWSGVGLACTYAGGATGAAIEALNVAAGEYRPHLAQGAAFAAKARQRAGNPAGHTERACALLCGVSAATAAAITDAALVDLPGGSAFESYETWRSRIRTNLDSERSST